MAQAASKGNCYLCGGTISKTAFKKHLLEKHNDTADDAQTCKLLKVEGTDEKAYWLYLDMPMSATLKTLDRFLRDIWLECCGHESAFFVGNYEQLSKNTMVGILRDGCKLHCEYDFGSTTELTIAVVGTLLRPEQRQILTLRSMQGLSYEEIGQCLGLRAGTVKSRLARAREQLRRALDEVGNKTPSVPSKKAERG